LLAAPVLPRPAPDVVFFDVFGIAMVTLPVMIGWVMLGLALVATGMIWHQRGRGRGHAGAALGGAGRMVGLAGLTALLVMGANLVSFHVGGPNYYDRLAAIPRLEMMAATSALAAFFIVVGRWRSSRAALVGALVPLWLAGATLQVVAPVTSYVVVVPVLLAALIALLPTGLSWARPWRIVAVLIAAPVIGYQFMLGHEMLQAVGSDLPLVVALPLVLATVTILPLWHPMPRRSRRVAVLGFGLAAIVIALMIRATPLADTIPPYSQTTRPVS
jgi:hypothetical protein